MQESTNDKKFSKNFLSKITGAVIVCILLVCIVLIVRSNKDSEPEIISQSNLEKIIKVSDLSTLEAVYNGIAEVKNEEKPEKIDYYVSYEAKIKAGFDFEQLQINVDDDNKVITVVIPTIEINDVNVDMTSLDFIFLDKKAETATVSEQAYKKSIEDATAETSKEDTIKELAKENAKNTMEALIKPFVDQVDAEYSLVIE